MLVYSITTGVSTVACVPALAAVSAVNGIATVNGIFCDFCCPHCIAKHPWRLSLVLVPDWVLLFWYPTGTLIQEGILFLPVPDWPMPGPYIFAWALMLLQATVPLLQLSLLLMRCWQYICYWYPCCFRYPYCLAICTTYECFLQVTHHGETKQSRLCLVILLLEASGIGSVATNEAKG